MSAVFGAADALFYPAATAVTPEILPAELLARAARSTTQARPWRRLLIGPALGGLAVAALGYQWAFAIDALSFAVSAGCILAMASRPRPEPTGRSALADARDGVRYVRSQRWLWVSLAGAGLANFAAFSPLGVLVPLLIRNVLHQGPLALGLVLAGGGVGGGLTALSLRRLVRHDCASPRSGWGGRFRLPGSSSLVSLRTSGWPVPARSSSPPGSMYGNILWSPIMQELVPPELLGRASSVDWLVSLSLSPLGVLVSGARPVSSGRA